MEASAYEVLAMIMKYWFIIVILYILWRIAENALREHRGHKRIKKEIDRYFYGSINIEASDDEGLPGRRFGIRKENVFGRSKRCDIPIASPSLAASHGMISLRGKKLMLFDLSAGRGVYLNGERVEQKAELKHGDEIRAGKTVLRIDLEG